MSDKLLKRLAGGFLDFGIFFGLCYAVTKYGYAATSLVAPLVFLLAAYGLTTIITYSKIAAPFVELAGKIPLIGPGLFKEEADGSSSGLLTCPLCTGMWVGAILAGVGVTMFPVGAGLGGMRDLVTHGLVGSGFSFFAHLIANKLEG